MTSTTTCNLYTSLSELLSPETLSQIAGHRVTEVNIEELVPDLSASGNCFLSVRTEGEQVGRYVVKRVNWDRDWIMRASEDRLCREAQVWLSGILDRLPPEVTHAIVACARDDDGYAILMSDQGDLLSRKTLDEASHRCYLNALAALHARYLDDPALLDPALGLCDLACYFTFFSPRVLSKIIAPRTFIESWDLADACLAPETTRVIKSLQEDPGPLCAALQHFPHTLVHGDWAPRNLGLDLQRSSSVLAIDWQVAHCGAPTVGLFRYLLGLGVLGYRTCYEQRADTVLDNKEMEARVDPDMQGDLPESIRYYRTCYEQYADTVLEDDWHELATAHSEVVVSLSLVCPNAASLDAILSLDCPVRILHGEHADGLESLREAAAKHPGVSLDLLAEHKKPS